MPIFLYKSILSLFIVLMAMVAMYTMFEVFGRPDNQRKLSIDILKKAHRINGYLFLSLFVYIAFLCIRILIAQREELESRVVFHSILAFTVFLLLALKIVFNRRYRQYYGQIRHIGLIIAILVMVMFGTSGGYYLTMTKFGTDMRFERAIHEVEAVSSSIKHDATSDEFAKASADSQSVLRGKELYESECTLCHDPASHNTIVGPGHKDILKRDRLPVSGKAATPENIRNQLRNPYNQMPSFDYLTEQEVSDLIAYLNTL